MKIVKLLALLIPLAACGPRVRELTYPSPCLGGECVTTGWEVWGTEEQAQELAQDKCEGKSAHVTVDQHQDYGTVYCFVPEKQEAPTTVSVERPTERPAPEIQKIDQAAPPAAAEPTLKQKRSKRKHR
jgi:hypothetical protein